DLYVEIATRRHKVFTRDGNDLHLSVQVPMFDAALGTDLNIDNLAGEKVGITIAPGTQPGERVRLTGKGMPQLRSESFGDMIAHVDVTVPTELDETSRELLAQL